MSVEIEGHKEPSEAQKAKAEHQGGTSTEGSGVSAQCYGHTRCPACGQRLHIRSNTWDYVVCYPGCGYSVWLW